MANIPRPRFFVSAIVWVISFCGLLMVWQAPPPMSSSQPPSDPSSDFGDEINEFLLRPRPPRDEPVRQTHVSNLNYLQNKNLDDSSLGPASKSYPAVSFPEKLSRRKIGFEERPSEDSPKEEDLLMPIRRSMTYHRSRIKGGTLEREARDRESSKREERRLLVHAVKKVSLGREKSANSRNLRGNKIDYDEEYQDDYNDDANYDGDTSREYYNGDDAINDASGDVDMTELGGTFNVTPPEATLMVYNRVPKCASSTMQTILRRLSKHLNFEHVSSLIYDRHQLETKEQESLAENLLTSLGAAPSHALSYDRHLYYTNFSALGLSPPVYINVVRDPVERFISSFYYRRSEERLNRIQLKGRNISPSQSWVNRTVEQCVLLNDPECSFVPGEDKEMMLSYFCGHLDYCRIVGNRDALQTAKEVVSRQYSVVGLVEHMDLSLLLLETLVPRFMDGATQIYGSIRQKEHMIVNFNHQKPKVSMAIREELLRRMSDDVDFYYFLEQRLFEQKKNFLYKS